MLTLRAGAWVVAGCFLAIAVGGASFLVVENFGPSLPGCGPESACGQLARSVFGRVPFVGIPVSILGLAYFSGALAAWVFSRRVLPPALLWVARAGVVVSLGYIGIMVAERKVCPYCLGTHIANAAFLVSLEIGVRRPRNEGASGKAMTQKRAGAARARAETRRILAIAAAVFAAVLTTLGVADAQVKGSRQRQAEAERTASVAQMVDKAGAAQEQVDRWGASGFTGRWRKGPEEAAIRIVMLTDYQCPDCKRLEAEAEDLFHSRKDLSLSIKHFPMCKDASPGVACNKYISRTLHQNACWAARAAEAAGILAGDEGFFKMHEWLFARSGAFTDAELKAALPSLGFDPASFVAVMSGPETLRRVQADVDEGYALGLNYTPMIFVNGVELKGWNVPKAITKTVEQVAASNPPPRTSAADRPVLASTKYVEDWREQRPRPMPPEKVTHAIGADAAAAKVAVIVFGDLQEDNTARIDEEIRGALRGMPAARYVFRHFPVCKDCNPALPEKVPEASLHPMACKAAQAAEAAGIVGGNDGYWKMHTWLLKNRAGLDDAKIRAGAREVGLDGDAVLAAMDRPEVMAAIREDAVAGGGMAFTGIPAVYVNGKWVPRTYREGDQVVARIMEAAARGN